jgi:uncharacterized protein (DUF983 family)
LTAERTQSSGGIGLCGLLTVLFVGLKLTGYITWSWWWVFAPLWAPFLVVVALFLLVGLAVLVYNLLTGGSLKPKRRHWR